MEVLQLCGDEWENPDEGTLLVKVEACGIGLPDLFMTQGRYPIVASPPVHPGQEVSGRVISVPPGSAFRVGERVMGITIYGSGWWRGGLADYAFVQERKCLRIPAEMSDEAAAGFVIGFRTAHAALVERVPVTAGERVLILGGAGSSGAAAIQLSKALGAEVIAVAGSDEKLRFCETIGADHVVSYGEEGWPDAVAGATRGRGVDVIFDPVGGATALAALATLATRGRIALVGFASGEWLKLDAQDMVLRNYSAVGVFSGGFSANEDARAFADLAEMVERGAINTPLGSVFEFDQTREAICSLSRPGPGKTVVRMSSEGK
ncbi:zinc-binding dehydrogenase [Henriciella aquimarina]|uniref:zinc-binding dehydrogenase n=1 Tax=Henriciella aquimarina TaxID=545261 RepID=UPI0009FC9668|nr:zinc-binding dehydrogenase [Henriciella aquimarina]